MDLSSHEGLAGEFCCAGYLIAARRKSTATMSAFYCNFFLRTANLDLLRK